MQKQDLTNYLTGMINAENAYVLIKDELDIYKKLLSKKGSSITIRLDGDVSSFVFSSFFLKRLNDDYSENRIDWYFRSYIADLILLSENSVFENEELRDDLEAFTER